MKVRRLREVRELLRSPQLEEWFGRYVTLRQAMVDARERRDDLLAQSSMVGFRAERTQQAADESVFESGELENAAEQARAEISRIENESFEALSTFEVQRQKASDAWQVVSGLESQIEQARQRAMDLQTSADAARKAATPEGAAEAARIGTRLAEITSQIDARARELEAAQQRQHAEESRRDALWEQVEAIWSTLFTANMARAEYEYRVRHQRHETERLFARSTAERQRAGELVNEASATDTRIEQLEGDLARTLDEGREAFGCALVRDFLYWPRQDDVRQAYAVPLVDEREHLNIQVSALRIYQIERTKGLDFLEPVPEDVGNGTEEDPRLAAFFVDHRPGAVGGRAGHTSQGDA
ncbi:MAG: hypothetical protein AAB426_04470 [Myxococcota bacterium]